MLTHPVKSGDLVAFLWYFPADEATPVGEAVPVEGQPQPEPRKQVRYTCTGRVAEVNKDGSLLIFTTICSSSDTVEHSLLSITQSMQSLSLFPDFLYNIPKWLPGKNVFVSGKRAMFFDWSIESNKTDPEKSELHAVVLYVGAADVVLVPAASIVEYEDYLSGNKPAYLYEKENIDHGELPADK